MRSRVISIVFAAGVLAACGGGGGTPEVVQSTPPQTPPPPPRTPTPSPSPAIAVTLAETPASLEIDTDQTESFTATVTGDPKNKGVTWSVICRPGMDVCGSVAKSSTASGEVNSYRAPADSFGAGTFGVQVTATSLSDPAQSASANVSVNAAPALVSPQPTPVVGNVGQYLNVALCCAYVQGGVSPSAVTLNSAALPGGLIFNPVDPNDGSAAIAGVPTGVSAAHLNFTYTDSGNPPIRVTFAVPITINPKIPLGALTPSSGSLPDGAVDALYVRYCRGFGCYSRGAQITVTGGIMPYSWSWAAATSSATPPGLVLDASCSAGAGLCNVAFIRGRPTATGTFVFLLTVTDSESPPKQSSANYSITVNPTPSPSPSASP